MEKMSNKFHQGVLTTIMFDDFCTHRLTIEADLAACRAKAVPSFLSYFMTLSIGSLLSLRPPALQSSTLPTKLILYLMSFTGMGRQ